MTIQINDLRKEFDVPEGIEVAVDDLDLSIDEQEFVTLVGPSGCGKTTTLRCVAGLEDPTDGEIYFDDKDVTDLPANKRGLAMMFQNIALYPHMTIEENIAYPLKVKKVNKAERAQEARDAAELMKIPELLDKHPGELSGGQRQRAALARTIVQDPEAFLMDEPLSDLDAKLKVEIRKEIQRVHRRVEKPTLYVTHDQEEAMTMSDRIAVMNDGNISQVGTPDELYLEPDNTFVARFIGNPSMNLVSGTLESEDGETAVVRLEDGAITMPIERVGDPPEDSSVIVGFRPEDVDLDGDDGAITGTITLVERIGDRLQATLDGPEGELRTLVSSERTVQEGETVSVSFDPESAHLFDARTEEIFARGDERKIAAN